MKAADARGKELALEGVSLCGSAAGGSGRWFSRSSIPVW